MAEADAGNKRRRSGRLSGQPPEQALNIDLERRTSRNIVASSVNPPTGQQPHGRSASAGAQQAKGQHKGKEPLEAFVSVLDTYCGPQSDGDVLDAAQSVAELWQLQEKEARAALQKVVGPLLEREQQLADRAAAIAALKQARRDKLVQHGPRVSCNTLCGAEPRGLMHACIHASSLHTSDVLNPLHAQQYCAVSTSPMHMALYCQH
jgi:hypothetical protein